MYTYIPTHTYIHTYISYKKSLKIAKKCFLLIKRKFCSVGTNYLVHPRNEKVKCKMWADLGSCTADITIFHTTSFLMWQDR